MLACSSDETERHIPCLRLFNCPFCYLDLQLASHAPAGTPSCIFPFLNRSQQFVSTSTHWLILNAKYTHNSVAILHTLLVLPFCRNTICSIGYSSSLPCCWYLGGQSGRIQSLRAVWATQGDRQHFHHSVSSHTPRLAVTDNPSPLLITAALPTLHDSHAMGLCSECLLWLAAFSLCFWFLHMVLCSKFAPVAESYHTFHSFKQFVDAGLFPYVGFGESHCYEHSYANLEWT